MSKARLDTLLVKRGFVANKKDAQELIADGKVLVGGMPNTKVEAQVERGVDIKLKQNEQSWVSRGAYKLLAGLAAFDLDPTDMIALDVGASTGGFTDVLLQHGARKVYAVDVGYGQLAWKLQQDERVVVLDRENIRTLEPEKLVDPVDIAVIDASFISLTMLLGRVAELMRGPAGKPIVALIKPQFEARKEQVEEGGIVRDPLVRQQCIDNVSSWAKARGFWVGGVVESPIRGPAGNVEFLIELRTP